MHALALQAFLEQLVTPQGRNVGAPFLLMPWETAILEAMDRPRDLFISMARGNGKSTFFAGLGVATLVGPYVQHGAETLIVASSFEQALVIYRHVRRMIAPWYELDTRSWKSNDTGNRANLMHKTTGAGLYVLGSDPKRLHGHAPVLVLADEPSQWPVGQRDAMLGSIADPALPSGATRAGLQGRGGRRESLQGSLRQWGRDAGREPAVAIGATRGQDHRGCSGQREAGEVERRRKALHGQGRCHSGRDNRRQRWLQA